MVKSGYMRLRVARCGHEWFYMVKSGLMCLKVVVCG